MVETRWPGAEVVAAARDGDRDSLAVLVAGADPHVRRFAHTLCPGPEDAEDAAQEALIVLYRRIGMLRATGALASWLFRIVRNECLRRARALRPAAATAEPPAGTADSAEQEALRRLDTERVASAIAALPADQRRVLIMRDLQGLGGRAVAEALGLSPAAMKSRLHRARAAVRAELGGNAGEFESGTGQIGPMSGGPAARRGGVR
ncbi:RNA polymerase sigma factor [Kitasatospora cineracea]|uniref:RNA polymerase sigma-70 factor (ECF subfamily) n=1 Tax=Kitasatospora cineracea TaxID=88074 RepID=A0A8G1X8G5_9ACTN|nr:sigma-70 family RNA polymerase sigma factor [Kitasatospora cineracea]ROR37742.1 RNA polymerase sigma-70 factor (ECF subfamily) [Kitasatospora cineracea]